MICPGCGHENFEGADRCSNCIGPLRDRDVPQPVEGFQRLLMEEPVSSVSSGMAPISVTLDATVADAVRLMKQNRIGCVVVVANDQLAGIFTERDLLLNVVGSDVEIEKLRIQDYMTPGPETVEEVDTLRVALNKMSVGGFRHIPVMAKGRVLELVTARDALKFLAREALKT